MNYRSKPTRNHLKHMFFMTCKRFNINPLSDEGIALYREILPPNTLTIVAKTGKEMSDARLKRRIRLNLIKQFSHLFDINETV